MTLLVGRLNYVDRDQGRVPPLVQGAGASSIAGRTRRILLLQNPYRVQVIGREPTYLDATTLDAAVRGARKEIRRLKGTALKRPKVIDD